MFLIIGLGNIGKEYEKSRHNIGFMVVDELAAKWKIPLKTMKYSALFGRGGANNGDISEDVILAKPLTHMNLSGRAVKPLAYAFSVLTNHIIIIHDDVDLACGKMKVKIGGSSAGHKGVGSILELIEENFIRIRIGIGRPYDKKDVPAFVLSPFAKSELPVIKDMIKRASEAVQIIIFNSIEEAQRTFNR
jgi:PTH1 family peptidyl-tRNA hydrolase